MSNKLLLLQNIKQSRKRLSWTQQDLAFKSGLPISVITKIEQGTATQPTIQTIIKLADAFNISIDDLIGRKTKK